MSPQFQRPQTPEEKNAEFQRQEAIRLANEGAGGEATPPDISPLSDRIDSPSSNENFDGTQAVNPSRSLEDRDTNDGDGNTENN